MPRRWPLLAALALAACLGDGSGPVPRPLVPVTRAEDARPLRVLFIGNSLTFFNDLPARTAEIAVKDTSLRTPDAQSVAISSATLRQLWYSSVAPQRIETERWDYVVLQENSQGILDTPETTAVYVAKFDSLARLSDARTVLYLTWTYGDYPQFQDSVTHGYQQAAARVSALIAPVGIAWRQALQQDPTLPLYQADSLHPAPVGTYLAANVMFATLYRRTPVGLAGLIAIGDVEVDTLTPARASLLQTTAWTVTQPYLPK